MGKLRKFMREVGIPADAIITEREDLAEEFDVQRVVTAEAGNQDWELWKDEGEWTVEGHGFVIHTMPTPE